MVAARATMTKLINEYKSAMAGLPNQPALDDNLVKELELKFKCDPLVA